MGSTWGPPGADRTQVGPMLAPRTFVSGMLLAHGALVELFIEVQIYKNDHGIVLPHWHVEKVLSNVIPQYLSRLVTYWDSMTCYQCIWNFRLLPKPSMFGGGFRYDQITLGLLDLVGEHINPFNNFNFEQSPNISCLLGIKLIFDTCHRSSAAISPAKYWCDRNCFREIVNSPKKFSNAVLVTYT